MPDYSRNAPKWERAWIRKQRKERERKQMIIDKPYSCKGCSYRGTEEQAKSHEERMWQMVINECKKHGCNIPDREKRHHRVGK